MNVYWISFFFLVVRGRDLEGRSRDLIKLLHTGIFLRVLRESTKKPVNMAAIPGGIGTEHLRNTSLDRYQ
jgi:hypothetical protein